MISSLPDLGRPTAIPYDRNVTERSPPRDTQDAGWLRRGAAGARCCGDRRAPSSASRERCWWRMILGLTHVGLSDLVLKALGRRMPAKPSGHMTLPSMWPRFEIRVDAAAPRARKGCAPLRVCLASWGRPVLRRVAPVVALRFVRVSRFGRQLSLSVAMCCSSGGFVRDRWEIEASSDGEAERPCASDAMKASATPCSGLTRSRLATPLATCRSTAPLPRSSTDHEAVAAAPSSLRVAWFEPMRYVCASSFRAESRSSSRAWARHVVCPRGREG